MKIIQLTENKKQYLDLLLLADELESMIDRYLEPGELFVLDDNGVKAICVVTNEGDGVCELKNIAVTPESQRRGYGKRLIKHLLNYYSNKCNQMIVGTGDVASSVGFYKNCGFEYSHRIENFFTNNYDHQMIEDGVVLKDMIYFKQKITMSDWFTIDSIDNDTYIISEYKHWEETHAYLLNGADYSLLIDTGLGIKNIYDEVIKLTDKPIIAVATHIHWDHIGGHKYFSDFYVHRDEVNWLTGAFPLTIEQIKDYVVERCELPEDFNIDEYDFFQGNATRILQDNDVIDIGGRSLEVLHTPGHSPGHMCFYEKSSGYLFTGDLVYKDTLCAYYPSTDPIAYLKSIERITALPIKEVFPAHHSLDIKPEILVRMRNAFKQIESENKLHHGGGIFNYSDFSIWL